MELVGLQVFEPDPAANNGPGSFSTKVESLLFYRYILRMKGVHTVINAENLVVGIKGRRLKKIVDIKKSGRIYLKFELLHELAFQALDGSFAPFEPPTRELRHLCPRQPLVCHQYMIFPKQDAVYPNIEFFIVV